MTTNMLDDSSKSHLKQFNEGAWGVSVNPRKLTDALDVPKVKDHL